MTRPSVKPRPRPRETKTRPQPRPKEASRQPINEADRINRELISRIREGDASALSELCQVNRPLVWKIAQKLTRTPYPEDAAQAGMIGLMRAVDGYDSQMGAFSTYATHCIRSAIKRAVWYDRLIRVSRDHSRRPKAGQKPHPFAEHARRALSPDSIVPIEGTGDDDPTALTDASDQVDIWEIEAKQLALARLAEAMKHLDAREAGIVRDFFGIETDRKTLEAIGEAQGVCKERIRQIKHRALKKLAANLENPL